jgi:hypothetical protein
MFTGFAGNAKSRKSGVLIDPNKATRRASTGLTLAKLRPARLQRRRLDEAKPVPAARSPRSNSLLSAARHDREKLDLPGAG